MKYQKEKFEKLKNMGEAGIELSSVWNFGTREKGFGSHVFHGNCIPQVVKQCILRYSNERDIILESKSKDTRDEALFIKPIVGSEPFVLVTTASHIPRSMALFKKLGMNPIPSPIGHSVRDRQGLHYYSFFPNTGNLFKTELAIHEYLGLTWAKLRGQQ